MRIRLDKVAKSLQGKLILSDISLEIEAGQSLALIGPNASGKSTLLRVMAGLLPNDAGQVYLNDALLSDLSVRELAQCLAFVSQEASTLDPIIVHDAVRLGRTPWLSLLRPFGCKDAQIVAEAMHQMEIAHFKAQRYHTLSGGEKQRVHIARTLAQTPQVYLLDEPTNHLDIHHQIAIMDFIAKQRATIVMALHDLNHAFTCDRIALLDGGKLVAFGAPSEVLTPKVIAPVFQVAVHQTQAAHLDHPILTFTQSK